MDGSRIVHIIPDPDPGGPKFAKNIKQDRKRKLCPLESGIKFFLQYSSGIQRLRMKNLTKNFKGVANEKGWGRWLKLDTGLGLWYTFIYHFGRHLRKTNFRFRSLWPIGNVRQICRVLLTFHFSL